MFSSRDGSQLASIQYLGPKLCGHPGIIHGGLLATMLDEGLARCCFPALPNKIGVTASLKVEYRKPCPADRFVVLKATTTKVEGRKAWVKGRIESLVEPGASELPVVYAEAEALFVEPKFAAVSYLIYFYNSFFLPPCFIIADVFQEHGKAVFSKVNLVKLPSIGFVSCRETLVGACLR